MYHSVARNEGAMARNGKEEQEETETTERVRDGFSVCSVCSCGIVLDGRGRANAQGVVKSVCEGDRIRLRRAMWRGLER